MMFGCDRQSQHVEPQLGVHWFSSSVNNQKFTACRRCMHCLEKTWSQAQCCVLSHPALKNTLFKSGKSVLQVAGNENVSHELEMESLWK